MITDNYDRNRNTNTRKTEELLAIFLTNSARYVSGRKLAKTMAKYCQKQLKYSACSRDREKQ
jgi:hypothetical protein